MNGREFLSAVKFEVAYVQVSSTSSPEAGGSGGLPTRGDVMDPWSRLHHVAEQRVIDKLYNVIDKKTPFSSSEISHTRTLCKDGQFGRSSEAERGNGRNSVSPPGRDLLVSSCAWVARLRLDWTLNLCFLFS
jgi:hypothetical protein